MFVAGAALLPLLKRLPMLIGTIPLLRKLANWSRQTRATGSTNQQSSIRTRFLAIDLDHDTGVMDGEILEGAMQGRILSALTMSELMTLREVCREDPESLQVLEAWLDRCHPSWREGTESEQSTAAQNSNNTMSKEEALDILDLSAGASAEQIVAAHRRLMQKLHPDRGGSTYLAAKLNAAKDLLLNE